MLTVFLFAAGTGLLVLGIRTMNQDYMADDKSWLRQKARRTIMGRENGASWPAKVTAGLLLIGIGIASMVPQAQTPRSRIAEPTATVPGAIAAPEAPGGTGSEPGAIDRQNSEPKP